MENLLCVDYSGPPNRFPRHKTQPPPPGPPHQPPPPPSYPPGLPHSHGWPRPPPPPYPPYRRGGGGGGGGRWGNDRGPQRGRGRRGRGHTGRGGGGNFHNGHNSAGIEAYFSPQMLSNPWEQLERQLKPELTSDKGAEDGANKPIGDTEGGRMDEEGLLDRPWH